MKDLELNEVEVKDDGHFGIDIKSDHTHIHLPVTEERKLLCWLARKNGVKLYMEINDPDVDENESKA